MLDVKVLLSKALAAPHIIRLSESVGRAGCGSQLGGRRGGRIGWARQVATRPGLG